MLNIIGQQYGRLLVIEEIERKGYKRIYKCLCECGNYTNVHQSSLRGKTTKSCGCIRKENTGKMFSSDENKIIYHDNYAEIIMVNINNQEKAKAIIDLDDIEKIKQYRWYLSTNNYAITSLKSKKHLAMHKLIYPHSEIVDHIDRNRLNNRKNNLRSATIQENAMNQGLRSNNTSGIKGVSWNKNKKQWIAEIMKQGIKYRLGYFKDINEARSAREEAEKELFKEFCAL